MHYLSDELSDTATFIIELFTLVNNAKENIPNLNLKKDLCVPIFKNNNRESPLDIVMATKSSKIHKNRKVNISKASSILTGIKNYPLGHVECALIEAISKAITNEVPGIIDYLDGRLVTSEHLK
jgi:hypothetical protein